ncbi:MAG TPA: hypothetical protein VFV32_15225 [Acidimicrobiales bacterium]|nr:hypothetical protein [Acidimicrobiales bacterium]
MPSITSFLRALGPERAVHNAAVPLEARRREEWLVAGLVRRLDQHDGGSRIAGDRDSDVPTTIAI